ncbi:MAG TPA: hypothetical protein ENJ82_09910 [Bacteroidetes bacterium]|nr:hypothetical protein [Bacteroidota bacterium]
MRPPVLRRDRAMREYTVVPVLRTSSKAAVPAIPGRPKGVSPRISCLTAPFSHRGKRWCEQPKPAAFRLRHLEGARGSVRSAGRSLRTL